MATLSDLVRRAETGVQWADICAIEADAISLVTIWGYDASEITQVNLDDHGKLASIELGTDGEGFGRFVLNFAI